MTDEILININGERASAIGEAFLSGYKYVKGISINEYSVGSEKKAIFMVMSKTPDVCRWDLKESLSYKVKFRAKSECNNKFGLGEAGKESY